MGWHEVQQGETVESIAEANGLTPMALLDLETPDEGRTNRERLHSGEYGMAYPGELIWLPDSGEEEEVTTGSTDIEDEARGDGERRVTHSARGGTAPATGGGGSGGSGGTAVLRAVRVPWQRPHLRSWLRWQAGLPVRHVHRMMGDEEGLFCAAAHGRRMELFWSLIRGRSWAVGADVLHTIGVGPHVLRCGLPDESLTPQEAVARFREEQGSAVPSDLPDEAVRFHAWRRWLATTGEARALGGSMSFGTGSDGLARQYEQRGRTLDPREPYYAPVARIRNLVASVATNFHTWRSAPLTSQIEVLEILWAVLMRGTGTRIQPGASPTLGDLDQLLRGLEREGSTAHENWPPLTVKEFYRVVRLSDADRLHDRLTDDRRERYVRMLRILDRLREAHRMTYLLTSDRLRSAPVQI